MTKTKKSCSLILIIFLFIFITQNNLLAQDTGEPAMKTVAIFSVGGGGAGAALGFAIWLLDPLNPDSDVMNMVMTGMGVGTIGGAVFGVMQLQKQAIIPNSGGPSFEAGTGFELNSYLIPKIHRMKEPFKTANSRQRKKSFPLANISIKF